MKSLIDDFDLEALKGMLPFMVVTALISALLVLGVLKASGSMRAGGNGTLSVAVFDVVKFANAQRALASRFIGKRDDANEGGVLLMALSKKTTAAIEKIAGPGTLVLVKQGVVNGQQVDITDAVLTELGLPTDVPTVDPIKYIEEVAPTMLMLPKRDSSAAPTSSKSEADTKVLP